MSNDHARRLEILESRASVVHVAQGPYPVKEWSEADWREFNRMLTETVEAMSPEARKALAIEVEANIRECEAGEPRGPLGL